MPELKIALTIDGIWPLTIGGLEKHSFYMLKFLPSVGARLLIFHPYANHELLLALGNHLAPEHLDNVKFIEIKRPPAVLKFPGHYVIDNYRYSKEVFKKLLEYRNQFDLIYAKGLTGWFTAISKSNSTLKNIPLIMNAHGYEMLQPSASFKTLMTSALLKWPFLHAMRRADYLVSYGGLITVLLKQYGFDTNRILEIPSGIDNEWIDNSETKESQKPYKFFYLGRYERRKGIEELNQVLTQIGEKFNGEFHFIGPIAPKFQINSKSIHYHGMITDLAKLKTLLREFDVLVTPSHAEGMPNVILEAMAAKCAIIATDVGAVRIMVSDSNGILIKPFAKGDLKQAMMELSCLPVEKMASLKENSFQKIKNSFNWHHISNMTLSELQKIATKNKTN